jgi:hypothetical protein
LDVQLGYRKDERGLGSRIKAKVMGWKRRKELKRTSCSSRVRTIGSSGRDECGINLLLSFGTGNEIVKVKNVAGRVIVLILEGRATHI